MAPEWGWAWPSNRRILYNRASADPERQAVVRAQAVRLVGRATGALDRPRRARLPADKRPDYVPPKGAKADEAIRGDHPFIMQADGRGWLFVPSGLVDGPFPTHFEPQESPFRNPLYGQQSNPARKQLRHRLSPFNPTAGEKGADAYPYVLTTFRLTEHHTAGGMTRTVPYLAEIQPEMFCEVSPALAAERGLENAGWATIITARTAIEARVLVTDRLAPLVVAGTARCSRSRSPGTGGRAASAPANPRTTCSGSRSTRTCRSRRLRGATCDIRPGRRPRGRALRELVESYPHQQAHVP